MGFPALILCVCVTDEPIYDIVEKKTDADVDVL